MKCKNQCFLDEPERFQDDKKVSRPTEDKIRLLDDCGWLGIWGHDDSSLC